MRKTHRFVGCGSTCLCFDVFALFFGGLGGLGGLGIEKYRGT